MTAPGHVRAILIPADKAAPCEAVVLPILDSARWAMVLGATYVEFLNASRFGAQLAIDDSALLKGRPFNRRASILTWGRYVPGPALVVGCDPWGETSSVDRHLETALLATQDDDQLISALFGRRAS